MNIASALSRRRMLGIVGRSLAGLAALLVIRPSSRASAEAQSDSTSPRVRSGDDRDKPARSGAPANYNPGEHAWRMAIDLEKCIGCGLCAKACKTENKVPPQPFYFRTWVERYIIRKAGRNSGEARGETVVDSPNGGIDGFPPSAVPKEDTLKSFFVPKLCNHCKDSPCTQSCPTGAAFHAPDGVVLVDSSYCIGCSFCIQACPYGCRFLHPETHTAEKCTLCYHRITRGLNPACVEVCPTGARIFGDLLDSGATNPLRNFYSNNKLQVLKPHLGTNPTVMYAGMDKEVR